MHWAAWRLVLDEGFCDMLPSVSCHRLHCQSSCIPGHTYDRGKSISLPLIVLRGPPERLKELNSSCCTHDVLALLARAIQASSRDPSRLQLCHFTTHLCQRTITFLALYSRSRAVAIITLLGLAGAQVCVRLSFFCAVSSASLAD